MNQTLGLNQSGDQEKLDLNDDKISDKEWSWRGGRDKLRLGLIYVHSVQSLQFSRSVMSDSL